jgi:hypothetical protein
VVLRRGFWDDIELIDLPDDLVLIHPGWISDRESLALAIREGGWFSSTWMAFDAAENARLKWGWIGTTDDDEITLCTPKGTTVGTGESVTGTRQVTLALISS